jgi:hypothetical protein
VSVHGYVQSFLRRMAEELPHVDLVLRELVTADQAGVGLAIVPRVRQSTARWSRGPGGAVFRAAVRALA